MTDSDPEPRFEPRSRRRRAAERFGARAADRGGGGGPRLRVLSYNIQAGVASSRYRHYITGSWKHLVPHAARWQVLEGIARRLGPFDLVGIQETDAGSLRTGFTSQTAYLARHAGFEHWYDQVNRELGPYARHSNGLLARIEPVEVRAFPLPGIRGRGALLARFDAGEDPLVVIVAHLALGRRGRLRQLDFLAGLVAGYRHVVLMGDFNCEPHARQMGEFLQGTGLRGAGPGLGTFPSWQPWRHLDYVLCSASIAIESSEVLPWSHSDHLPVAVEIRLPQGARLAAPARAASAIARERAAHR